MKYYNEKLDDLSTRKAELNSIKTLVENNKRNKAMSEISKYVRKYPEDNYGMFYYGKLLMEDKRYDEAKYYFEKVAESEDNNKYSAMSILGSIAQKQKDYTLAKKIYKHVLENSTYDEKITKMELARLERREKNYDKSLELLKELNQNDSYVMLETAKCYIPTEKLMEASVLLNTIPETTNERLNREVKLQQGIVEYMYGCFDECDRMFEELKKTTKKEKDTVYYQVLFEQTKNALKKKDYEKAIKYGEELVHENQTYDNEISLYLGLAYQETEKYDKALSSYKIATDTPIEELKGEACYYLGTIQQLKGDFIEAEENLLKSINVSKEFSKAAYYKLVTIAIRQNDFAKADKYLNIIKGEDKHPEYDTSYKITRMIVDKNLGLENQYVPTTYMEKQIASYNIKDAYYHVKEHLGDEFDENTTQFNKNVDLQELFIEVPTMLNDSVKINDSALNVYDIDYKGIGLKAGVKINTLRVVTEPVTNNIITMYPSIKRKPRPKDFKKEKEKTHKKEMSQLDKFYARYNMKK